MTIKLLMTIIDLNQNLYLDVARILILMDKYFEKNNKPIEGTTKIVKMDFLLRYPTVLEKALEMKKKNVKSLQIHEYERNLVESKMIRYKFGPWDDRYWSILSIMESMNLVQILKINGVTSYQLTEFGKDVVSEFESKTEFVDYANRSKIITSNFGDLTATGIMKKVYEIHPKLLQMKLGEEITP